jgi:hypothetical protein
MSDKSDAVPYVSVVHWTQLNHILFEYLYKCGIEFEKNIGLLTSASLRGQFMEEKSKAKISCFCPFKEIETGEIISLRIIFLFIH